MIVNYNSLGKYTNCFCVLNFSGGKDSIYLLHLLIKNKNKIDLVIFADTGLERAETYSAVKKAQSVCELYSIKFVCVRSEQTFFDIAKVKGVPNKSCRWCNSDLKIYPMKRYISFHARGQKVLHYIGLTVEESYRLNRSYNKSFNEFFCYPLYDLGVSGEVCKNFCAEHGYYSIDYLNTFRHSNCFCCPFMWDDELQHLTYEQTLYMCSVNDSTKFKYRWSINNFLENFKKSIDI